MTTQSVNRPSLDSTGLAKREFSWWGLFWGTVASWFALAGTITNYLHYILDLKFLPVFEKSLAGFRDYSHWLLDIFVFNALAKLLSQLLTSASLLLSNAIPEIAPIVFSVSIPAWFKNLALVAIVVSKAQERAFSLSKPQYSAITEDGLAKQREALGFVGFYFYRGLWYPISVLDRLVFSFASIIANFVYLITRQFWLANLIWNVVRHGLAGATLVSLIKLLQRTIESLLPPIDDFPAGKYVFWVYVSLGFAATASVAFILYNGYALQYIPTPTLQAS